MNELIKAYDEYIKLLTDEIAGSVGLAYVHGYVCQEDKVKRGEELRERIERLKSVYGG